MLQIAISDSVHNILGWVAAMWDSAWGWAAAIWKIDIPFSF